VSAVDTATFTVVAFVLALITMVASCIPARRTLRVDPFLRCGKSEQEVRRA
jgi:hypothetical protein